MKRRTQLKVPPMMPLLTRVQSTGLPVLLAAVAWALTVGTTYAQNDKPTPAEVRAIAKEAYIFNYPLVMMYRTMYLQAIDEASKSYSGGFGKWWHLGTSSP